MEKPFVVEPNPHRGVSINQYQVKDKQGAVIAQVVSEARAKLIAVSLNRLPVAMVRGVK